MSRSAPPLAFSTPPTRTQPTHAPTSSREMQAMVNLAPAPAPALLGALVAQFGPVQMEPASNKQITRGNFVAKTVRSLTGLDFTPGGGAPITPAGTTSSDYYADTPSSGAPPAVQGESFNPLIIVGVVASLVAAAWFYLRK